MRHHKLSAGLSTLLNDYELRGREALAWRSQLYGISGWTDAQAEPAAVVFVHCDPEAEFVDLHPSAAVHQPSGAVRTATVPLSEIDGLSERPEVNRIRLSRYLRPRLDEALPRIGVPRFRQRTGLTGANVLIGIVDSGVDPSHAALRGRIVRALDQTQAGHNAASQPFGLELTGAAIGSLRDESGHGTHVAGAAAGRDEQFDGVAPDAQLVVVKTDFNDARIAEGVRFVFRVADELRLPAVVNLSLGGHLDAHDGSDELSRVIDELSGPGRIVCCAAGNEGVDPIHARIRITQGNVGTVDFEIPAGAGMAVLNGWYGAADSFDVAIGTPTGEQTPFQGIRLDGQPQRFSTRSGDVFLATPGPHPVNGDHHVFVQLISAGTPLAAGLWKLLLRGTTVHNGTVDVWSSDEHEGSSIAFRSSVDDTMKIGSPGCASAAITVAGFSTKIIWRDIDSLDREDNTLEVDSIAPKSSPGPLRNGGRKPDIAAPGFVIVSALSAQVAMPDRSLMVSSDFAVRLGTSMSTAVVSGLVAAMLEGQPRMTPEQAKARLRAVSTVPSQPAGTFDLHWGAGRIAANRL